MHPSYNVKKTYLAEVPGPVEKGLNKKLKAGIELEDGPAKVDSFKLISAVPGKALVEIVLHEGRKHIVRRLMEAAGYPVQSLVRVAVGDVSLGNQRPGSMRVLNRQEVGGLYKLVGL